MHKGGSNMIMNIIKFCEIPQQNDLGTETQNQTVVNPRRSNRKLLTYSS